MLKEETDRLWVDYEFAQVLNVGTLFNQHVQLPGVGWTSLSDTDDLPGMLVSDRVNVWRVCPA